MALFSRGEKGSGGGPKPAPKSGQESNPLVGRKVLCGVCESEQMFTSCWRRMTQMRKCPCCEAVFENPAALYKRFQPRCPKCAEPLEQPSFDYGICDRCGSKFEIVEGTKPGLLANKKQRAEMAKFGKARDIT